MHIPTHIYRMLCDLLTFSHGIIKRGNRPVVHIKYYFVSTHTRIFTTTNLLLLLVQFHQILSFFFRKKKNIKSYTMKIFGTTTTIFLLLTFFLPLVRIIILKQYGYITFTHTLHKLYTLMAISNNGNSIFFI